jgi:undecaprenyl-diphosphatase
VHVRRWRVAFVTVAIAMVILVAFSRMYLGAHYFSDVLAAACSSAAWLVLCLSFVHNLVQRKMVISGNDGSRMPSPNPERRGPQHPGNGS